MTHHDERLPLLLLHGGGVARWMWRPLIERLPGSAILAPDLPGHGDRAAEVYPDHDAAVEELTALVRRRAPDGVAVVGFSLGAQLAMCLAATHPGLVRSVVLVSAETVPAPLPRFTLAALRAAAPLARRPSFARAQARQLGVPAALLPEYVRDSARLSSATLLASVGENIRFTIPDGWATFPGRAAVVVGERERRLMRRSAELTAQSLPGSRLVVVPGAGHDVPLTAPAALAAIIDETCGRVGA